VTQARPTRLESPLPLTLSRGRLSLVLRGDLRREDVVVEDRRTCVSMVLYVEWGGERGWGGSAEEERVGTLLAGQQVGEKGREGEPPQTSSNLTSRLVEMHEGVCVSNFCRGPVPLPLVLALVLSKGDDPFRVSLSSTSSNPAHLDVDALVLCDHSLDAQSL
jgi:hypothetical protein